MGSVGAISGPSLDDFGVSLVYLRQPLAMLGNLGVILGELAGNRLPCYRFKKKYQVNSNVVLPSAHVGCVLLAIE